MLRVFSGKKHFQLRCYCLRIHVAIESVIRSVQNQTELRRSRLRRQFNKLDVDVGFSIKITARPAFEDGSNVKSSSILERRT